MSATIAVHVQPKARQNQILGFVDGVLRVRLSAAPVDGKANEGNPCASRHKVVEIEGWERWRRGGG
ncbi:MAG: Uncharacterized conserved protein YggU, UPF0235/DUF167 family [Chloroflexi bacterium]|jgi:uncharacterized protein YggU (UPF0235/DUF167 family)|nr:MAG: Uncharacterized conserved protein YggU, UPF0235/DUF167 family [Chloroflexota bacterium]